jgi:transposase-like protein
MIQPRLSNAVLRAELRSGKSRAQVARDLGVHHSTIGNRLRHLADCPPAVIGRVKTPIDMDEVLEKLRSGMSRDAVARAVGVCRTTLQQRLRNFENLPVAKPGRAPLAVDTALAKRLLQDLTLDQVAVRLRVGRTTLLRRLREAGVTSSAEAVC